ncbi:MAG TPA: hypothetical protein VH880_07035 [Anaeromyxobacteraceae bacterium]|jgi:hypothetical protein
MSPTRAVAVVLLCFLLGGSSAEVAVRTHRAFQARSEAAPGGDFLALEVRRGDGELLARPRLIASPGRPAHLVLRDPADPERVRLELRVEATREPSGVVSVDYELSMPGEDLACSGRLAATPGVEHSLDLGDRALAATLLTLPVPSAAFDAWLEAERAVLRAASRHT